MPKVLQALVLFAISCCLAGSPVYAQDAYPAKPVRMIIPFAPGGPADIIAEHLELALVPSSTTSNWRRTARS